MDDMRWLEEIRVMTQPQKGKEVLELLLETAVSASRRQQPHAVRVFSHYSAPGGFSLVLVWDTASVPLQGSDVAILIIEGLKSLGLLDHTIMIEKWKKEKT